MYIWVILAFFITTLFSYNLSHRADIREITVSPRAQSVASKVVIQHEAASGWVRDRSLGGDTDAAGNMVLPPGNLENVFMPFGQRVREVPFGELGLYLPFGFREDRGPRYTSFLYCLDRRNLSASIGCNDEFSTAYLITYGCVAQRWVSLVTGKPNKDLEFGISEAKATGAEMGYTEDFRGPAGESLDDRANRIATRLAIRRYEGGEDYNMWDGWGSDDYDPNYHPGYGRYFGNFYIMRGRAEAVPIPMFISDDATDHGGRSFHETCVADAGCLFCLAYITSFR
jgi:hypothetical protein